jgi:hypothetical protein
MRRPVAVTLLAALIVVTWGVTWGPGTRSIEARSEWRFGASADVVLEWNQLLQATLPANASLAAPRFYAMMHIAMFDAANSVEREYSSYRVKARHGWGGSAEVAAAQAAHDVLVALIPASTTVYDAALAARLDGVWPHLASSVGIGSLVAREILAWRQDDGWAATPPPYVLPPFPGLWQPAPGAAVFTQYPQVIPFALLTGTQYLPSPPPTLTSERYAKDFDEVKRLGSATSAERTIDQTQIARLFAALGTRTNLYMLWNNVARDLVRERNLDLLEAARLFVLLNVGIIDGVQTTMSSKYVYGLWRPVTAIQRAGEDLNPLTDADPGWTPLLTTPPYPTYAGNQACVAAAAARALAIVAGGDDFSFAAVWQAPDGSVLSTRWYSGFRQMADEQARSRVYGGIHFTFDNEPSQQVCPKVVDFIAEHFMVPNSR